MLLSPTAGHPFVTGIWDTALLVLMSLVFTGTVIWLWWRSREFEPEIEDQEETRD
jgi:hypothetical protein